MFRVSVTMLDQWQAYLDEVITLDTLLERIKTPFQVTAEMNIGTAFHAMLESETLDKFYDIENNLLVSDGFCFDVESIKTVHNAVWNGIKKTALSNEIKTEMDFTLWSIPILLVGKADSMYGNLITEYKTTWKTIDTDRYLNSWQWKAYCALFGVDTVNYNIFRLQSDENEIISIRENCSFACYKSNKDFSDLLDVLESFYIFINGNFLDEYFKMKD